MSNARSGTDSPSDAVTGLLRHAENTGGVAFGLDGEAERPRWADKLIRQFNDAGPKTRCPHLWETGRAALWLAIAPDLLACFDCLDDLIERIETRLGHSLADEPTRCSICGTLSPVRSVSLASSDYLLRGQLCPPCAADSTPSENDVALLEALSTLKLPPITVPPELSSAQDRDGFDQLGCEMLARAGMLCERIIDAADDESSGLDPDQALVGGLLVRAAKLTHAIFTSAQSGTSEAHAQLSRCLGETTITLRWLVWKSDPRSYRRFRADSFARWHRLIRHAESSEPEAPDDTMQALGDLARNQVAAELDAAGLTWDDVPERPNAWGPDLRQRFVDLSQAWIYETLFVSHSNYVHPSWHEIRAFHLRTDQHGVHLDPTCATITPVAAFLLSRLVVEACRDTLRVLPHDLDVGMIDTVVGATVQLSQRLSLEFSEFMAHGGLRDEFHRHHAGASWFAPDSSLDHRTS